MIKLFKIQNWPMLLIASILLQPFSAVAYYEAEETSRPPSAFSLCCCKKETEETNQVVYSCKYEELTQCPEGTKHYNTAALGCPSDLILTKYHSEESVGTQDVEITEDSE